MIFYILFKIWDFNDNHFYAFLSSLKWRSRSAQEIYRTCREYIANSNPKTDIEWWAENHGPGMNLNSTSFQVWNSKMFFS